jgi:ATP-dependent helicase/nuclease subunit A
LPQLPAVIAVGQRLARNTVQQQRGIWLHALLQHLADGVAGHELCRRSGVPQEEFEPLLQQAQRLMAQPELQRYFDPHSYRKAYNEVPYVDARGAVKRIDRLVEFDDEVWVLDYKTGEPAEPAKYRAQMTEYRAAMQAVHADKPVRCALLFGDGVLCEIE